MKKLIIKANTNSDFDNVSIFKIDLTNEFILRIKQLKDRIKKIKEIEPNLYELHLMENWGEFLCDDNGIFDSLGYPNESYKIVEELDKGVFLSTETILESFMLKIDDKGFSFSAIGKYTDNHFFTDEITFDFF